MGLHSVFSDFLNSMRFLVRTHVLTCKPHSHLGHSQAHGHTHTQEYILRGVTYCQLRGRCCRQPAGRMQNSVTREMSSCPNGVLCQHPHSKKGVMLSGGRGFDALYSTIAGRRSPRRAESRRADTGSGWREGWAAAAMLLAAGV